MCPQWGSKLTGNLIKIGEAYEGSSLAEVRELIGLIYPENFTFRGNDFQTARVNENYQQYLFGKTVNYGAKKTGQKTILSLCPEW